MSILFICDLLTLIFCSIVYVKFNNLIMTSICNQVIRIDMSIFFKNIRNIDFSNYNKKKKKKNSESINSDFKLLQKF